MNKAAIDFYTIDSQRTKNLWSIKLEGFQMISFKGRRNRKNPKSNEEIDTGRRCLLKSAAVVAVGSTALGFPHISKAQTTTLKMQTAYEANDVYTEMARQYVDRVEAMSGGKIKITLYTSGAVVKTFQLQEAVHKGVLDGVHTVTAYWYGKHKAASLFGTGPIFGANAQQLLAWIHRGGGKELYRELVQDILKLNLVGFFTYPFPTQPLGWFKEEIKNTEQLKNLKYRTVGLAADVMQEMGLEVLQLPGDGIIPAFERGAIDAFEYANPTSDRQFGAQKVSKFYMMGSYHQAAEFFEIIFNKDVFESLPKEHQAILEYAADAVNISNYSLALERHSKDLELLIKEDGVNVYRTPQSIMDEQLKSWDKVLADLMKDPFFKKVVDSQKEWIERVAFYDLINTADFKRAYMHYFPGKIDF
ncbi:TRAP transporter substrate-binding protein [Thermodesulfobacteriota bacterium]